MGQLTESEANCKAFAQRLKAALDGMSARKLALAIGIAPASVNDYLAGNRFPGADVAWAIACHLGVSADWLIGGKGPMRPADGAAAQPESPDRDTAGEPTAPAGEIAADVIEMAGQTASAIYDILKAERLLRDFEGHEFGDLIKLFLRIETRFGIRKDYKPDMDSYRKLMGLKKK